MALEQAVSLAGRVVLSTAAGALALAASSTQKSAGEMREKPFSLASSWVSRSDPLVITALIAGMAAVTK